MCWNPAPSTAPDASSNAVVHHAEAEAERKRERCMVSKMRMHIRIYVLCVYIWFCCFRTLLASKMTRYDAWRVMLYYEEEEN